jgi:hypothetical protein
MAKKTALETTEEQVTQPTAATVVEETTQEVDPKLQGHPSRDFQTPLNQG